MNITPSGIGASELFSYNTISNDGTAGYCKIFTVTLTSNYVNANYEFVVTSRRLGISNVLLYISSDNDRYASEIGFHYYGENTFPETNLKAFHYKDTTNKRSTIQVWIKLNAWDEIHFFRKTFMPRCSTIAWEPSFVKVSAFPTDATNTISCSKAPFYSDHSHECMSSTDIDALF